MFSEIAPIAIFPAELKAQFCTVAFCNHAGAAARMDGNANENAPIVVTTPRRARRRANLERPRTKRLDNVPSGIANCRARFTPRASLQIAQHDRRSKTIRQTFEFFVKTRTKFLRFHGRFARGRFDLQSRLDLRFRCIAPTRRCPRFSSRATSDAVQPVADHFRGNNAAGPAYKHKKRRLERVLGVHLVEQHPPTHAPNHWTVSPNQRLKRSLVPRCVELFQQLSVRSAAVGGGQRKPTQMIANVVRAVRRHDLLSPNTPRFVSTYYCREPACASRIR